MRISVVFASIIFIASLCGAVPALAQEAPESRASYGVGVASSTLFEDQAYTIPGPIVYGYASAELGNGFSADTYVQAGKEDESHEIDLILGWEGDSGPVRLRADAGAYLYPSGGSDTVYVASVGAEVPMGPVSLELGVDRYAGGLDSTVYSAALSGTAGPVDVAVGRAYNDPEDIAPWFARVSVPVGPEESGLRLGVRAFWGADEGAVLEVSKDF